MKGLKDSRTKVKEYGPDQYDNDFRMLRGLICKECDAEIIYVYVVGFYICFGCGL